MAKEKQEKRFVKILNEEGFLGGSELWVDRQTGVTYFYHYNGYTGGMTLLVDANGKPVISPIPRED